jgi:hypothetical protein
MVLRQRRSWRSTQFSRQRRLLRHHMWRLECRNSSAETEISRRNRHRPWQALHRRRLPQWHPLRPDLRWKCFSKIFEEFLFLFYLIFESILGIFNPSGYDLYQRIGFLFSGFVFHCSYRKLFLAYLPKFAQNQSLWPGHLVNLW